MKLNPQDVLSQASKILSQRNKAYKNNYISYGKVMEALFPKGVELQSSRDHVRFHMIVLLIVKLTRYANNYEEGGDADSLLDAINYLAFLKEIDSFPNPASREAIVEELEEGTTEKFNFEGDL